MRSSTTTFLIAILWAALGIIESEPVYTGAGLIGVFLSIFITEIEELRRENTA